MSAAQRTGQMPLPPQRSSAFDMLRLLALGMVIWQHVQSLHAISPSRLLPGLDVGQLGVTLFIAMAGWFAFGSSDESAAQWLLRRASRIYIPFWLAFTLIFAGNAAKHVKPADAWLVFAEFAGIATFTHGSQIIGAHLWFISFILACYVLTAIIRCFPRLLPVLLVAIACGCWFHLPYGSYLLAYLVVGAARKAAASTTSILAASAAMFLATWLSGPRGTLWCPSAIALLTVALGQIGSRWFSWPPAWTWPRKVSEGSYHAYLMHGPVLHALSFVGSCGLAVDYVLGCVLTAIAATMLFAAETTARSMARGSYAWIRTATATG